MAINMVPYILDSLLKIQSLNSFDVIHVLKPNPINISGIYAKHLKKIPLVLDFNDLDSLVMRAENHPIWEMGIMKLCEKYYPKEADHILVCSSALKTYLLESGISEEKISWIPNGVFSSKFLKTINKIDVKQKLGLKKYVITYLGNLNQQGMVEPLLKAFKNIIIKREDVSCLIVGEGLYRRKLMDTSIKLGLEDSVKFTGRVPSIVEYLLVTDISIAYMPEKEFSKYASNVKLFEYLAAGTTPIVSRVGDLPFYIGYGEAGVVVENKNVSQLTKAILQLLEDDEKRKIFSKKAQEYAVEKYDWNLLSLKVERIYNKILKAF